MGKYCFRELKLQERYSTNRNDLVTDFYNPCLERAFSYDRAAGYFHSSVFLLTARSIADFAIRKGKIRLICSPELTSSDIEAFTSGYKWKEVLDKVLLRAIDQLLEDADRKPMCEFIATLIAVGCLDIRIAFRPGNNGIFHDKIGIFHDEDGHEVSFTGSSNETFRAWNIYGNHESFDVFCSWTTDAHRVRQHVEYFENLWSGIEPGVETIHFPKVAYDRLITIAHPEGIEAAFTRVKQFKQKIRKVPQIHQTLAIEAWKHQGCRGILQHATGSGKTFTALTAIRDWLTANQPVLILVPSELLLAYWYEEIQSELEDLEPKILLAGGGYTEWRRKGVIEGFTMPEGGPRILLSTLQTASAPYFLRRVQDSDKLMLVVDEVHRAGSIAASKIFSIQTGARLGLSATPYRYGDPEGTRRILQYFEGVIDPPFTLADAIAAKRLCQYTYHIHIIELNTDEMREWRKLTQIIKKKYGILQAKKDDIMSLTENIKKLLFRRADILKNAEAKVPLAIDILKSNYKVGQRWLIYCDDKIQLQNIVTALKEAGMPCDEYHSSMLGSRNSTLDHFLVKGGIIVAIKCLDEGIDIPTTDHALILASSRNPREFIQRRGRVLRVAEGKFLAHIHDVLVQPPLDGYEADGITILRNELYRAVQFAEDACNESVMFQLRQIARKAGIDLEEQITMEGLESEDEL